jgi:beta-glucosidase
LNVTPYLTVFSNNGSLSTDRVDDMVHRIMTPYFFLNQDADFPLVDGYSPKLSFFSPSEFLHNFTLGPTVDVRCTENNDLIRHLGAAGTVLLKNTNASLPLKRPMNLGVFGNGAADLSTGQYSLM